MIATLTIENLPRLDQGAISNLTLNKERQITQCELDMRQEQIQILVLGTIILMVIIRNRITLDGPCEAALMTLETPAQELGIIT